MISRAFGCMLLVASVCACNGEDHELHLVGIVEKTLFELAAPVSEVLISVHVERGQQVEEGEVLAHLDPTFAEIEVSTAEAALAASRHAEAVARHDRERLSKLRARKVASEQDLERALLVWEEAKAREREARGRLQAAQKHRYDRILTAPAGGVVDQIPFDKGERVPAGAVLAVIVSDEDPWVRVWIPETSFARVGPGSAAEIRIDALNETLRGQVLDVAREPEFTPHYALTERDRAHLVYEARVRILDAPSSLRPGIPAEVLIQLEDAGAGERP